MRDSGRLVAGQRITGDLFDVHVEYVAALLGLIMQSCDIVEGRGPNAVCYDAQALRIGVEVLAQAVELVPVLFQ